MWLPPSRFAQRRRIATMLLAAVLVTCGCTHLKLARSTLRQGSTLPDLHFQQVVDNLALFAANPDALAWHLKLKGGTVQITDLEAGVVGYDFRSDLTGLPGVNGQRTVLGQWDVEPATDADELEVLQLAYKKAVQPGNKDLDAEIRSQMWQLPRRPTTSLRVRRLSWQS